MKRTLVFVLLAYSSLICRAQFTLKDWNIDGIDENATLRLDVSEYKLNYNHPLPYADWQKCWTVKVELCCGTLGTEQVFVCKEGKASHLIGHNSLAGDISIGFDNMQGKFFVEVTDRDEHPHRLCAGPKVERGRWYTVEAKAEYDVGKDKSTVQLLVDGQSQRLTYPGKALRHNCSLWVIGHGFPGGFPNALQVRDGALRHLAISGEPLARVEGQNPLFTGVFTADPAFTVVGETVYAYVGEDKASVGQSLMTVKMSDAIELHLIGRQEGHQASLVVKKHQRMVEETVTMIVHIVTFEEEGSILRSTDKGVPYRLIAARISMDVHAWARYFR